MKLKKFRHFILDTLFPIQCVACDKNDCWICEDCLNKISLKNQQVCPICKQRATPNGKTCFDCQEKYALDGLLVASFYRKHRHKTVLLKLIHYYKYRFISNLQKPLGKILLKAILNSSLHLPDFIVPIPLHPRRLRWRGFNQAELLANYLSKNLTPSFEITLGKNIILRNKYTQPQMKIHHRKYRLSNLKGAFELNKKSNYFKAIKNKNILLVDDIATTGSTLFECAKILKQQGKVRKVYGVVLARQ